MKKILILILSLSCLIGCTTTKDSSNQPETTIEGFLESFKQGNFEKAEQYFFEDEEIETLDILLDDIESEEIPDFVEELLNFDYTINKADINDNKATINVDIVTYNMEEVYTNFINYLFSMLLTMEEDDFDDDHYVEAFIKALEEAERNYKTTVTFYLINLEEQWIISSELNDIDDIIDGLLGGLYTAIENIW